LNSAAPDAEVFIAYMKRRNQKYMLDSGPLASASGNWMIQDSTEYRGDLISAGVTLKVPVWSLMNLESAKKSGQLNIDANREEKEMNIRTYSAVLKKMHAEIEYLRRAEKEYSGKLIPELEKTLRLAENSYRASKTEFSDIVNSRISLVQARLSLLEIRERQLLRLVSVLEITDSFFE
ncbi:MAG TPA: TolC family protein, partial [Leptospiraceae bacterium]|nr:TolC family protein [Leptospiraceae bacterium]